MPVTSLNHYLIVSKNLERSKKFYQQVLGLELAERPDFGFPGYWLKTGDNICVHLASQDPNKVRDQFLLKKHPRGTNGSGSVDHIAFLAKDPFEVRNRIQKNKVEMHFRSFPDAKLFQIFLKDPDDVTIELNFLGEVIDEKQWKGEASELIRFLVLFVLGISSAQASEALWTLLKGGGQVIFIRHAITTPGVGDPPGFKLDDCGTQRNLTDEGRAHARRIGEAFRKQAIPVERIVTSPWCRCIETAKLAFGKHDEVSTALSNLFGRHENRDKQVAQLKTFTPKKGNLVMVSHGSTIVALTGISPDTGEMVIVTPQGGGKFAVAGRLGVN